VKGTDTVAEVSKPNKPDAANPAIPLWLTIDDQRRRVADLERSAT